MRQKFTVTRTKLINTWNEFKHTDKYEFNSSEKSYNFSLNSNDRKMHKEIILESKSIRIVPYRKITTETSNSFEHLLG